MGDKNRERITEAAEELFNHRGYRLVTMSDIARHLGMGKKRLYQYFTSKEQIAEQVFSKLLKFDEIEAIKVSGGDPVTKLRQVFELFRDESIQVNPIFIDDTRKYAPDLWGKIRAMHQARIPQLEGIIREGQEAGLIRREINPSLAVCMFFGFFRFVAQRDRIRQTGISLEEALDFYIKVFLNGICEQ